LLIKYAASALSQTNSAMIQDITRGVPAENAASIAEESIPLPYCSKPMSAVAFEREADFGDASCVTESG